EIRASWYASVALIWAKLRDFDRAYDGIRRALSLAANDGYVLNLESTIYGMADRWTDALRSAELSLEADPGAPYAVLGLGTALINLGRVEESAARLSREADHCQSYEIVLSAFWHQCALAETLHGDERARAVDQALTLAGRVPGLMPLADRESRRLAAIANLDIAELADDSAGIERWASEVQSPFHRQMLANLALNKDGKRIRLPFRRTIQKYATCLPSSIAAAMSAGGIFVSANEMSAEITFGGTHEWAAADWLRERGYHVRVFFATPETATRLIRNGIGFVISLEDEESGHAVAVVGMDERAGTLLVHDPNSFRSTEYLLTALDPSRSPVGIKGMAVVREEDAAKLDALLPPESEVMAGVVEHSKQMMRHGPTASRQVAADLLGRFPSHPGARYVEAVQALEDGQVGQALGKLKDLLRQFPRSPLVRFRFVSACRALGNTGLLRQALKDIVETGRLPGVEEQQDWIYPPDFYVYLYADLLRRSNDTHRQAERLLLQLLRRQGASAGAWHILGDLLWQEHDLPGSLLSYRVGSCLAESDEHYALAYSYALAVDKKSEEGFGWLESRVRRFQNTPHAAGTWVSWISALEEGGYPERALAACNEALAQPPVAPELLSFAVPFFARMGDWIRAEAELERLGGAGSPPAFLEASTRLDLMRGDLESAARHAAAWTAELPHSLDARRSLLEVVAAREGPEAAVDLARHWMRENRFHEAFEEFACAQLDRAAAPKGQKYSILLKRLRRDPDDGWAWRELVFDLLEEYNSADDRRRERLEPRVARYLAECERTSAGTVPTVRLHALWSECRGDWAAAVAGSLESIALDPMTPFSYRRAWACSARLKAEEREALWSRVEQLLVNAWGRLTVARDVAGLMAERMGSAAAGQIVEGWREARPDDPDIVEAAAVLLIDDGHGRSDAARAIGLLEPAVRRYPYHPGLRFSLARAYRGAGRDADAEAVMAEFARRHPDRSSAKIHLAWIRNRQGDADGACRILDEARTAEPRNPELLDSRAQILIDNGRLAEAVRDIESGIGRMPLDVSWRVRAVTLLVQCGAADRAVAAARGGVEARPRNASLWLLLGRTLNELRQYAEVGEIEACFRRSLKLDGALFEAADLLAILFSEQRRYDDAAQVMRGIEPRLPDPSPALGRLAWIRRQRGEKSEAVDDLARLVEDYPWYSWGWAVLMEWLEEDAAWDRTRQLLQAIPRPMLTNTRFREHRLLLLESAKADVKQLDEEWDALLRDFPEDASLHSRRYDVLCRASRWKDAEAVIEAIARAESDDVFVMARRCEALSREGHLDAAREVALRICFWPVEESTWPADKIWEIAKSSGFAGDLARSFRQRLRAGERPALHAFSRLAAHAMRNEKKRRALAVSSFWFPHPGVRELMQLVKGVTGKSWDGSGHRAVLYSVLSDYDYEGLVTKLASEAGPAAVVGIKEWAKIGRAFVGAKKYAVGRAFLGSWRERTGVAMWMATNYVLTLSRRRPDELRERYESARDALAGLPHDHCAKYLAHIQAEACALLGRGRDFLET
ncbi:MAG TPA: tetratricopeptide repeat protein, partial [Candidatus Bathyarchaeia archaeon]|nr:tetratricopeptide repeat protein [Candidatus Bathyarchaeia archaeon]